MELTSFVSSSQGPVNGPRPEPHASTLRPSGSWHRVVRYMLRNISEDPDASNFRLRQHRWNSICSNSQGKSVHTTQWPKWKFFAALPRKIFNFSFVILYLLPPAFLHYTKYFLIAKITFIIYTLTLGAFNCNTMKQHRWLELFCDLLVCTSENYHDFFPPVTNVVYSWRQKQIWAMWCDRKRETDYRIPFSLFVFTIA
jgi:hypothetical protein